MMLGLTFGTKITLKVDGEDESEAIEALYKFIDNNFHE